jgi:predicted adenylyl cyclase CyaB
LRPRRNIELKARDTDPERSLATCEALGAEAQGVLLQRDTYFNVARGRLKLREEEGATAQLIAYERPNLDKQRESRYRLIEVGSAEELEAGLSATLGVKVVVAKERRLLIWQGNVRVHLDTVEGLGRFIEFEAVASPDSDLAREQGQIATLRDAFRIEEADLIAASYSDLMLAGDGGESARLAPRQSAISLPVEL